MFYNYLIFSMVALSLCILKKHFVSLLGNAAFLRLKNLSLTYDFKHKLLKSAKWLSTCQVSLTGSNLFTISGVSDYWDPETTNTNGGYPTSRIYSLGVTLGF